MTALMEFTSHIAGKNARVAIYNDRIEWEQQGKVSALKVASGAALFAGARKGGSSEMIPIRAITSVTTKKDGMRNHAVSIITGGNTIDMRVSKSEADEIKSTLTRLMLA